MDPVVALAAFPVVFVGELPDKTMLASLVLATRGRPLPVWLGAAAAFAVHVAIAVTVGVAIERLLPHRATDAVVAAGFALGAALALWPRRGPEEGRRQAGDGTAPTVDAAAGAAAAAAGDGVGGDPGSAPDELVTGGGEHVRVPRLPAFPAAFVVIFVAEWGDLTQVLTAGLAARTHDPLSVAVGAVLALWAVAGLAVVAGRLLVRLVPVATVRRASGVLMLGLAVYSAWVAVG